MNSGAIPGHQPWCRPGARVLAEWASFTAPMTSSLSATWRSRSCRPARLQMKSARSRFRKEALALAKLDHPNIATIFEFGSQGSVDFLVAAYIQD